MIPPLSAEVLATLERLARRAAALDLRVLFAEDADRHRRYCLRHGPLLLDLSRQAIDTEIVDALLGAARERGLLQGIRNLLDGAIVNPSERRPALHTALRADEAEPLSSAAPALEAATTARATLARMLAIAEAVRSGEGARFGIEAVSDFVSIGIGGSELGPRLAVEALSAPAGGPVRVHFLANVDGHAADRLLRGLDPRRTLVCVISKSFGTEETRLNAELLRGWLRQGYAGSGPTASTEARIARHFFAVTARPEAARADGIEAGRILPMWDWVGGRYSLWSAVGLPIAVAIGAAAFRELLAGAATMDRHFRDAPLSANLPVLLGLVDWWNASWRSYAAKAIVPYDERLAALPAFLQQLEMESNGKGCGIDGLPLARRSAPVIWGGVGTNVQHAFFQALHQGTEVIPVEFLGVIRPAHGFAASHRALLANMLAQAAALMQGRSVESVLDSLHAQTADAEARLALVRQQAFPGNRPSTTVLLDSLDPGALGALLALYEHKVFVQAWMLGINAFDQWGVELGKAMARALLPRLSGALPERSDCGLDAAALGLLERIGERSSG